MTVPDTDTPIALPGATLVHLHFINPDTGDRSTWIGTCAHKALLRDADGRLNLEVMIDVDPRTRAADTGETTWPARKPHAGIEAGA